MNLARPLRLALAPAAASALLAVLLVGGCTNPFKPADPQPPSGEAIVEDFSSIDAMLNTMGTAIQTKSTNGADTYIRTFADSLTSSDRAFRAFYDPAALAAWLAGSKGQTAPDPWTLANERGLHSRLSSIRQNDPYVFNWIRDTKNSPGDQEIAPDVWSVHIHYTLYAEPDGIDPVIIAIGYADLLIQKVGSRWSIFEWHDRVDPDYGVNPSADQKSFTYYRLDSQ